MPLLTGGQTLVESLKRHNVDTLFALPGIQNDALFNALYDTRGALRVIHPRHEQGAAYMALGYAKSTGRVGAYAVVPGPGFLNTTAALATAYAANARVLCITGQIPSANIGRGYGLLHEIPDQFAILRGLTKWCAHISHSSEIPRAMDEAFFQLHTGRPRPVALEIPTDVLAQESEIFFADAPSTYPALEPDPRAIEHAAQLLCEARKPLIMIGSGVEDARAELIAL
ncbi:MAG: hypothetical protein HY257_09755, partial [Chloroflexi bacterium]|nr:hypothetical protein [Chloroflexota bacterium]